MLDSLMPILPILLLAAAILLLACGYIGLSFRMRRNELNLASVIVWITEEENRNYKPYPKEEDDSINKINKEG